MLLTYIVAHDPPRRCRPAPNTLRPLPLVGSLEALGFRAPESVLHAAPIAPRADGPHDVSRSHPRDAPFPSDGGLGLRQAPRRLWVKPPGGSTAVGARMTPPFERRFGLLAVKAATTFADVVLMGKAYKWRS